MIKIVSSLFELGVGGVGHLDEVQHLKGRDFEVPMCGAVYLTTYNPELCDWYQVGEEILCYGSFQNCAEILINLLSDSKKMEKIHLKEISDFWLSKSGASRNLFLSHKI